MAKKNPYAAEIADRDKALKGFGGVTQQAVSADGRAPGQEYAFERSAATSVGPGPALNKTQASGLMSKMKSDPYTVKGPNIQPPAAAYDVKGPNIQPPAGAYDVKGPDIQIPQSELADAGYYDVKGPDITIPGVNPQTGEMAGAPGTPAAGGLGERPTYTDNYGAQMDALYDQMASRQFSYDANTDALYKTYRDRYMQQGKMAMQDTMGQAAGLTGGYGNTYAQGVGQQSYDRYLTGLADKSLDLRNQAFSEWQAEGDRLRDNYNMLNDRQAQEYQRYLNDVNAWQNDRDFAASREDAAFSKDMQERQFQAGRDDAAFSQQLQRDQFDASRADAAFSQQLQRDQFDAGRADAAFSQQLQRDQFDASRADADREYELRLQQYTDSRGDVDYERLQHDKELLESRMMQTGYRPTEAEMKLYGWDQGYVDALLGYYNDSRTGSGGGYDPGGDDRDKDGDDKDKEKTPKGPQTVDEVYEALAPMSRRVGNSGGEYGALDPTLSAADAEALLRGAVASGLLVVGSKDYMNMAAMVQKYKNRDANPTPQSQRPRTYTSEETSKDVRARGGR